MPLIETIDGKKYLRCDECRGPRSSLAGCAGCVDDPPPGIEYSRGMYMGPWLCGGCLGRHRHRHARGVATARGARA